MVDRGQDLIWPGAEINFLPQIAGITVEQRLIGRDVDVRIPRLGEQPRPLLHVEILPVLTEAESQKPVVGRLPGQVVNDLLSPPPQDRITAQHVWPQPSRRGL